MKTRRIILLLTLLGLVAAPALAKGGDLLIRNGKILTVTRGVLDGGDILIRDGIIRAIGAGLEAPPPASGPTTLRGNTSSRESSTPTLISPSAAPTSRPIRTRPKWIWPTSSTPRTWPSSPP